MGTDELRTAAIEAARETVRYTYRLRPGAQAEAALLEEWGRNRWVWNQAVHQQQTGRRPNFATLCQMLTDARARNAWLREGSRAAQSQTLRTYAVGLSQSFRVRGRNRPQPKSRKRSLPSLQYGTNGFALDGGRLILAKGISIPVVWSRELSSAPSSVRVYQDPVGHWYASFVVTRELPAPTQVSGSIGIDWGVKTTATATDSAYDLPFCGHRARCAAELAKAQRRMSRRRRARGVAPSKGYLHAKRQAAKLHRKAARQNAHVARTWAKRVVDHHQLIAVEDFRPKFLARSTMARKAADAAIGATKHELIERGKRAGREVVLVAAMYTTMTCSECGARAKQRLGLGERTFRCTCGYTADRDRNAARVILATAENGRAGADDVRHSTADLVSAGECGLSQEARVLGGSNVPATAAVTAVAAIARRVGETS